MRKTNPTLEEEAAGYKADAEEEASQGEPSTFPFVILDLPWMAQDRLTGWFDLYATYEEAMHAIVARQMPGQPVSFLVKRIRPE